MSGSRGGDLRRSTIAGLEVAGKVPELEVEFSSGHRLRTMVMTAGRPQWSVRLPDRRYLSADDLAPASEADEARRAEWEKSTESGKRVAARWGRPVAEPKNGRCEDCIFFTRLDGEGCLIEYGVCAWRRSPFDGRVVSTRSGCPEFRPPR